MLELVSDAGIHAFGRALDGRDVPPVAVYKSFNIGLSKYGSILSLNRLMVCRCFTSACRIARTYFSG